MQIVPRRGTADSSLGALPDGPGSALPNFLQPFAKDAAPSVMIRMVLDSLLSTDALKRIFEECANTQYTRNFTLDHFVHVLGDVVCGHQGSVRAAFRNRQLESIGTASAFYAKLNRMETGISGGIVRDTAERARELIVFADAFLPEPVPGYSARILDGNVLTGTEHRLEPTRATRSACLPGKSLAIFEPSTGLVLDIVLEENAHAQERSIVDQVEIQPNQLWIFDRNFCVRSFLTRIMDSQALFVARRHSTALPYEPIGELWQVGRCATGMVFEQQIKVTDPASRKETQLRRIVLKLDKPTTGGDVEIELVTNLPVDVSAITCCDAYQSRWKIERHYQILTDLLHCELPTLGYPKAALFAFSVSVVAGNAYAVIKANLRATQVPEMVAELSDHQFVTTASSIYPGMMVAIPPEAWGFIQTSGLEKLAAMLRELAQNVIVEKMLRSRRGPKKPSVKKRSGRRMHHLATKKLIDAARKKKATKQRA